MLVPNNLYKKYCTRKCSREERDGEMGVPILAHDLQGTKGKSYNLADVDVSLTMASTGRYTVLLLVLFTICLHKVYSNPVLQDGLSNTCPCVLESDAIWNCKHLGLTKVPKQCWTLQPEVKQILLSNNDILIINSDDFDGISPSLIELMLDHNKINYVDQQAFSGLSSLEILNLSHNDIVKLPESTTSELKNLRKLVLIEDSSVIIKKVRGLLELFIVTVYGIVSELVTYVHANSAPIHHQTEDWTTRPWWTTMPWLTDGTTSDSTPPPSCPPMFEQVGSTCIFVNLFSPGTWQESQYMCHALGSDLITIESAESFENVLHYINNNGLTLHDYWIGGNDTSTEGDWRWVTGNKVHEGSPYWATKGSSSYQQEPLGATAENCLCLDHLRFFYMDDQDCSVEKPAICGVQV